MSMASPYTAAFVRDALGRVPADGPASYPAICTDTRALVPGALFVALTGDRFDGHDFLAAARDAGAAAAVVRRGTDPVAGLPLLEVDDTLRAWGDLAHARRALVPGPVIAITGQNGKTSTKEMVAAVLATRWRTWRTRANNNNLVGVPLTILEAPHDTEALVVEAGANLPGEIARYREIIVPDIAVVTSAGAGHLEGFGSVAGVVREKLSLTTDVPRVITGTTPPDLAPGARARGAGVVTTAGLAAADLVPERVELLADGRPRVTVDGRTFDLAARGLHQAGNAMFAWAIARELGLDLDAAARALEGFTLPGGRGELTQHGELTILNDGYNANPESFTAAIALAASLRPGRRLVFVAGTMKELGEASPALHQEVARELAALAPDVLVLVGDFVPAFDAACPAYEGVVVRAPDSETAGPLLGAGLAGTELVVLKGSRGAALERLLPAILPRAVER
ncbi:MAG TPA: UDP-N-acetylmuramoyl-tripeptide--D-alanyl-D-alanine ligase [Gemmatimonadales bacterium]|nr:UDP-N-acetylmuramoyl-tripeptide--D-alanyl-D-alanine ligase [Gemmatimonadales bacterium]